MLGAQISEGRGRRTGRRVLATTPHLKVEASVEEATTLNGVQGMAIITYTSQIKPDGSLHGEGEGVFASPEGDLVTFRGVAAGQFGEAGSVHYSGSVSYTTTSSKLASLNGVAGVFQWDIDAEGNTHSKIWALAPAGASRSAGA